MDAVLQVIYGGLGAYGFCMLFHIRGKKLTVAAFGGVVTWTVFLLLEGLFPDEVLRYFLAAAAGTVYGEVFARVMRTPTTTFLVASAVPLIPGSGLYYTMNYALREDWAAFSARGFHTVQLALALALGIIAVTTLTRLVTLVLRRLRKAEFFSHFHS